jgi:hypothetical protein
MKHQHDHDIAIIKARILRGDLYHDIAADYRINQGRLSDVKHGGLRKYVQLALIRGNQVPRNCEQG